MQTALVHQRGDDEGRLHRGPDRHRREHGPFLDGPEGFTAMRLRVGEAAFVRRKKRPCERDQDRCADLRGKYRGSPVSCVFVAVQAVGFYVFLRPSEARLLSTSIPRADALRLHSIAPTGLNFLRILPTACAVG